MNSAFDAAPFRRVLLAWFRQNGRDLPWRHTTDPYAILVSEFMLQQTQVATVIPYYYEWMRRFPDFAALAAASEAEVLHAWQGLGYYARARNLRSAALTVMELHHGRFPQELEAIRHLPGVGRYTANAVATFAFNDSLPIVEANIGRLLSRLFDVQIPIDSSAGRETLWQRAGDLLPSREAAIYNSALMDLGARICTSRPRCEICPVHGFCRAQKPSMLPLKRPRPAVNLRTEHHSFLVKRGRVLLEQSQQRWRGMWILPRLESPPIAERPIHISEFPFTNHRITLRIFPQRGGKSRSRLHQRWFPLARLDSIPIPSPHRRALAAITHDA